MEESLMTFDEAYTAAVQHTGNMQKISILLGNGFSIGYDPQRFSFTNLLETAKCQNIIPPDSDLAKVFDNLQTADFEKVIKILEYGKFVAQIYLAPYNIANIEADAKKLKKLLVNVITNNHPEKASDMPGAKSSSCLTFLKKFKNIYTLNYDLLSYWVIMSEGAPSFKDGFGGGDDDYVEFQETEHSLLFLHGALHLFDNFTQTIKLTYCRTGESLKKQIYRNLLKNVYPVFISEGTCDSKLEKIRHNYYLNRCYKSLRTRTGTLFIFGTALKSNDEHIRQAIINGKFDTLYIGVWGNADLEAARLLQGEFEAVGTDKKPKRAFLYDSKTLKPWGE